MVKGNIFCFKPFCFCLWVILPFWLFGCTGAKSIENNSYLRDSVANIVQRDGNYVKEVGRLNVWQHDSTYAHDSVMIVVRNDTVFHDRWHWQTNLRLITEHKVDTIIKQVDHFQTVTKYVTKYKDRKVEVERKLSLWENMKVKFGGYTALFLLIVALTLCYKIRST